MNELWGNEACTSCKQAFNFLQKTPFEFKYVDVSTLQFEGEIPRLVLEDGEHIIGLGPIIQYVKKWMKERGIT